MAAERHQILDGQVQIFRRANSNNWHASFSVDGKQIRKSLGTDDLKKAKSKAQDLFIDANARTQAGLSLEKRTFRYVTEKYEARAKQEVEAGRRSKADFENWVSGSIRRYFDPYFGERQVDEISDADIDAYNSWRLAYWTEGPGKDIEFREYKRNGRIVRQKVSGNVPAKDTLEREQSVLIQIFKHAIRLGLLPKERMPEFPKLKGRSRQRPAFEEEEVQKILDELGKPAQEPGFWEDKRKAHRHVILFAFVLVAKSTGARPDEIMQLKWKNFWGVECGQGIYESLGPTISEEIKIMMPAGKTGERPVAPDHDIAAGLSLLWTRWSQVAGKPPGKDDPLFFDESGKQMDVRAMRNRLKRFLKKIDLLEDAYGVERTPYSFRHYYATLQLLKPNANISLIAKNMGTSEKMLEQSYSKLDVFKHGSGLRGRE